MHRLFIGLCVVALSAGCVTSGASDKPAEVTGSTQTTSGLSAGIAPEVNGFRRVNRLSELTVDARLERAAQAHADDMARKGYFNHTGLDGASVGDRVKRQGYSYCFVAENIAQGQQGALQALAGWQRSDGHRKNLLSHHAAQFGLAQSGGYWVMVLAKPGC